MSRVGGKLHCFGYDRIMEVDTVCVLLDAPGRGG
jgi:hypothetical protein